MQLGHETMDIAVRMLSCGHACDSCLGRQFAKLKAIKGRPNAERGKIIRSLVAKKYKVIAECKNGKCFVCEGLLDKLPEFSKEAMQKLKKMDFATFMVGIRMSDALVMNEETLWEKIGVKYSEPIKAEISRELIKAISKKTHKKANPDRPDILITFDLQRNGAEIFASPLLVYGEYKKFVRGLPQTSSPLYRQTVQDIIAKPFMKASKGSSHVLHALGREDKEARCLAWRPFVLEIKQPQKRKLNLKKIAAEINKNAKVKVAKLRVSGRKEVAAIKSKNPYKIYRVIVDFEKPVDNIELVKRLAGMIKQRTPSRVMGRKGDRTKHKKVKSIRWKRINSKRYQFDITAESGLYLNELVTGDEGRTRPSVSHVLGNRARIKEFDLIGLEG